jgi:hypothetical protein
MAYLGIESLLSRQLLTNQLLNPFSLCSSSIIETKECGFLHIIVNYPNTNYNLTKNFGFFYYSLNICTFTKVSYWPCPSFFLSSTRIYLQQTTSKFDQE